MNRNRIVPIAVASLLASAALILSLKLPKRAEVHLLRDGTEVTLKSGRSGKELRFYHGRLWQRPVFKILGTNISWRLRGDEMILPSYYSNSSVAVVLSRAYKDSQAAAAWSEHVNLVAVRKDGREMPGLKVGVSIRFGSVTNVESEEVYWEFPALPQKWITYRCYFSNGVSDPTVLEFTLPGKEE